MSEEGKTPNKWTTITVDREMFNMLERLKFLTMSPSYSRMFRKMKPLLEEFSLNGILMDKKDFGDRLKQQLKEDGICPLCGRIDNVVRAVATTMKTDIVVHRKPKDD